MRKWQHLNEIVLTVGDPSRANPDDPRVCGHVMSFAKSNSVPQMINALEWALETLRRSDEGEVKS